MATQNDEIAGLQESYLERRDMLLKLVAPADIRKAWFALSHLLLDEGSRVIDMGCDDGAVLPGDGCDANCLNEPGYFCMGEGALSCVDIDEMRLLIPMFCTRFIPDRVITSGLSAIHCVSISACLKKAA